MKEEFTYHYGKKNLPLLRALLCYYRVLNFRVVVLMCTMQKTDNKWIKEKIRKKLKLKYGVDIGLNSKIGLHPWVEHYTGLVIGDGVIIGDNCKLYQGVTLGQRNAEYPSVGNNVTIYPNAVILGGIKLNDNSIVLAGSVVLDNVPMECIVGGNPACIKKRLLKIESLTENGN